MTISVAVADDQALVRVGFCGIIAATEGLTVVGEAANGAEAVAVARAAHPDVVLMDVRMPVLDGIEATRRIAARPELAGVHVVILTTFELDEYIFDGLRAGAAGFLVKEKTGAEPMIHLACRDKNLIGATSPLVIIRHNIKRIRATTLAGSGTG